MFTGIIQKTSEIESVSVKKSGMQARIVRPDGWKIKLGESISVDGVCSTVAKLSNKYFEVEYMTETLKKTTVPFFKKERIVNLERPLAFGDGLGGHFVQGHVDAVAEIMEIRQLGNSVVMKIEFPKQYRKFIAEKGSICVNGVSLTVVAAGPNWFSVSLVNYTLKNTNLRTLKKGDKVNLEVDIIARYLEKLMRY